MWILAALMIATFDISKAVDSDGKTIEPLIEFQPYGPVR
jgi:hypothetical protein